MSQALDKEEEKQKIKVQRCIKCKVMYGHEQFQSMCSVCFKQTKNQKQTAKVELKAKDDGEEQVKTPSKHIQKEKLVEHFMLLDQAPRKSLKGKEEEDNEQSQHSESEQDKHYSADDKSEEAEKQEQEQHSDSASQPQNANLAIPPFKVQQILPILSYPPVKLLKRDIDTSFNDNQPQILKRTYEQSRRELIVTKGKCKFCLKKTGLLGISCKHCQYEYCSSHRLPENHSCEVDFASPCRRQRRALLSSILPKHKGKIAQI